MKKIVLLTTTIIFTLCIFIACDNGVAFVNDIKPLPTATNTDGDGYSTVIFVTADNKEKIYDPGDPEKGIEEKIEPDPELTYTHVPLELPPGVEIVGSLIRVAGEEAGEYEIKQGSLALAGENASKYTLVFIGATFTIYEKGVITIIANNKSKFENDPDPALDYYIAPSAESLRLSFGITIEGALARTAGETPGDYTIGQGTLHQEGPDAGDWRIEFTPGIFHIANAGEITVSAISFEKFYGEDDPIFTFVISPAALPDGLSLTGALARPDNSETAGDYYIKQGSLTLAGNATDGKPYHLKFNELTPDSGNLAILTIKKKTVTVTATSFTRVYNSDFPDFTYTNNQNLPDDAFEGDLVCDAATMANVGVFAIRQGTLALTTATDGAGGRYVDNYNLAFVNGTLTITDNNIIHVAANAQSKYYGDSDPVLSYTPEEALPAGLSFTGVPTREIGENVGEYAIKQGSLALTGTNSQHYTIAFTNSTLTINQKALTVRPSIGQSKIYTYDDPDAYTFTTEPIVDIGSAFGATKLSRAAGDTVGNYAITQGNLALQGSYATNYYIVFDDSRTFAVTPCPVVIAIYPTSKVRDDDDPEFDYAVTPSALMDVDNWKTTVFKGSFTRNAGETEGTYTIRQRTAQEEGNTDATKKVQLIGDYAANYQITTIQTATFRITPPGPVNISDPVKYMKPIITELHDTYAQPGATFRKADGPLKRNPATGEYDDNIKGETFLGSFAYWYDSDDNTVYYYYGGPVYLYGDCHNLFEGCYKYTTMDMTGFNTQYVTNMYQMFFLCYNVEHLDLSGWSFDSVTRMDNMFDRCEKLETISFSPGGVDLSRVTRMNWMFAHNFYMTPEKLRAIIAQWKLKDNDVLNPIFTDSYSNDNSHSDLRADDGIYGKNRLISNDMGNNNPSGISSSNIKTYIKDRDIPSSNGYSGAPPSKAFNTDLAKYTTADGVELYLGVPNTVRGQRLNLIPAGER